MKLRDDYSTNEYFLKLFAGRYEDFTPDWFKRVGTIICMTLCINIFSTPFFVLIFRLIAWIKRVLDQCKFIKLILLLILACSCKSERTKKKKQSQYEKLYIGPLFPVDFRYSQVFSFKYYQFAFQKILNVCFVCFLYSSGIPILYFITFLSLLLRYWFDKFYCIQIFFFILILLKKVLKFCQIPSNFDQLLEKKVFHTLYLILILHLVFAIWIFGSQYIFDLTSDNLNSICYGDADPNNGYFSDFLHRLCHTDSLPIAILLLASICFYLLLLALTPLRKLWKMFLNKVNQQHLFEGNEKDDEKVYYEFLTTKQIIDEIKLIELTIQQNEQLGNEDGKLPEELINKYKKKVEDLKTFLGERSNKISQQVAQGEIYKEQYFIGFPSYDIRHNAQYHEIFAIDEEMKSIQLKSNIIQSNI